MNQVDNDIISIIVPVYNTEKYLSQCLESLINQTYKDIEIICVNDGSTDSSRSILLEYSKKDYRIKIINKENGGLSSARNAGLKNAIGEYIGFVDSDDWCAPTMFEKLLQALTIEKVDIVFSNVSLYDEINQKYKRYLDDSVFSSCSENIFFNTPKMACNKIYRREIFEKNRIRFLMGAIYEDEFFFLDVCKTKPAISSVNENLYFYRKSREGAITSKFYPLQYTRCLKEILRLQDENIYFEKSDSNIKMLEYAFNVFKDMILWSSLEQGEDSLQEIRTIIEQYPIIQEASKESYLYEWYLSLYMDPGKSYKDIRKEISTQKKLKHKFKVWKVLYEDSGKSYHFCNQMIYQKKKNC